MLRKHYFKPGREEFRQAFKRVMPQITLNGAKSWDQRLREIIEKMAPEELRKEALGVLREQ